MRRVGLIGVLVLTGSMQIAMGFEEFPNLEIAFVTLAPWWAGSLYRSRRELVARLAERRRSLEEAEDAYVRLSVRRERAAIARELHDIVAHHLAVIVVQAGAGRMATHGPPLGQAERLRTIGSAGEQALADMARLVDVLQADRDDTERGFARLPVLMAQAAAGGLDVRLTPLPAGVTLPEDVEAAAVVVIQESLTNAMKHAPGAAVHISVDPRPGSLGVEVIDEGPVRSPGLGPLGAGLGLRGMRERVEALGGTLAAGPHAGGWRVRASLPCAATTSTG